MDVDDLKGLVIITGIIATYTFIILGCLESRLKRVDRIVKQVEDDSKYIN